MRHTTLVNEIERLSRQIEDAQTLRDPIQRSNLVRLYIEEAAMVGARFAHAEAEAQAKEALDSLAEAAGLGARP